jgi:hypothetical protein
MSYLVPIGFAILIVTIFIQVSWMIFFCPAEKGPPPDWSLYPIPPAFLMIMVGSGWFIFCHY